MRGQQVLKSIVAGQRRILLSKTLLKAVKYLSNAVDSQDNLFCIERECHGSCDIAQLCADVIERSAS